MDDHNEMYEIGLTAPMEMAEEYPGDRAAGHALARQTGSAARAHHTARANIQTDIYKYANRAG